MVSTGDGRGQAQAGLDLHYIYIRPKKKNPCTKKLKLEHGLLLEAAWRGPHTRVLLRHCLV